MSATTLDDEDQRPALLKSFAEMRGDVVARTERAVRVSVQREEYVP